MNTIFLAQILRNKIILSVFLLFFTFTFAQEKQIKKTISIQNSISNRACENDKMERSISIYEKTSKIGDYNCIGCNCTFEANLKAGNYTMIISVEGYKSEPFDFEVKENQSNYVLNSIILNEDKFLKEVSVFGIKKRYIKVTADKTSINVQDNAMLNTGNAYEAVKKLPGIVVAPDGTLKLNGKPVTIQIDDLPNSLSGNDLKNYLSGLPASALEKIELIYNPGAKYDANTSGSVVNMVTNSKRLKGVAGNFNINYNFNKYQKPSPQIMLNGKVDAVSWNIMTGYNYIDSERRNGNYNTFLDYFKPSTTENLYLDFKNFSPTTERNFYVRTGLNYKLNKKSNILFNYNGNFANNRNDYESESTGNYLAHYFNKGLNKEKSTNNEYILQYKTKIDTLGTTLDVTAFVNQFNRTPISNTLQTQGSSTISNNSRQDFGLLNYYGKIDLSFPITKLGIRFNTGIKYNTIDLDNNGSYLISNTSNKIDFDYLEKNAAVYAEINKKFFKKLNATLGLRFEDFNVERKANENGTKSEYNFSNRNFFPSINLLYELNDDLNFSTSYSRKIQQPYYGQLDPNNGNYVDKYNTSQGNILLNPAFFDNYEFKITAFQYASIGANFSKVKDANTFLFSVNDDGAGSPISNQTTIALNKKQYGAYIDFPIPLDMIFKGKEEFKKRQGDMDKLNLLFFHIQYNKTTIDNYDLSFKNKGAWVFAGNGQVVLPWNIKATMNYFYIPVGNWEIYQINKPIQQFDISFNRDFFDKKLKLGLHAFDLFNQNKVNANVSSQGLNTLFTEKMDSRVFRISLTWNFGKLKTVEKSTIDTDKIQSGGGIMK